MMFRYRSTWAQQEEVRGTQSKDIFFVHGGTETSNSAQLSRHLLLTIRITAAPSALSFQLPVIPDQPQIRANETTPNSNVALTLILTLTVTGQLTDTDYLDIK